MSKRNTVGSTVLQHCPRSSLRLVYHDRTAAGPMWVWVIARLPGAADMKDDIDPAGTGGETQALSPLGQRRHA